MSQRPSVPPKPGHVKVLRALYKYTAQYHDELSFEEGDVLYVTGTTSDPNWLRAICGNKSGIIPCNYVTDNVELIETPLHDAAKRGNLAFLEECLRNGVSVNGLDKASNTALYWASHAGHVACMNILLQCSNIELNVQVNACFILLLLIIYSNHISQPMAKSFLYLHITVDF